MSEWVQTEFEGMPEATEVADYVWLYSVAMNHEGVLAVITDPDGDLLYERPATAQERFTSATQIAANENNLAIAGILRAEPPSRRNS